MTPDELMRCYEAASASHDLEATLALIDDEAVYLFSTGAAHIGKAAVTEALRRNFAAIEAESYRIEDLHWLAVGGEVAAGVYTYHWSGRIGGQPASGSGRGTTVLRRLGSEWRVVHEHLSRGDLA